MYRSTAILKAIRVIIGAHVRARLILDYGGNNNLTNESQLTKTQSEMNLWRQRGKNKYRIRIREKQAQQIDLRLEEKQRTRERNRRMERERERGRESLERTHVWLVPGNINDLTKNR